MTVLTDKEIRKLQAQHCGFNDPMPFARAVEAAVLAKLACAEMQEPVGQRYVRSDGVVYFDVDTPTEYEKSIGWEPVYTEAQLRQYGAACAARQLSKEPDGWVCKSRGLIAVECPAEDDYRFHLGTWEPLYARETP